MEYRADVPALVYPGNDQEVFPACPLTSDAVLCAELSRLVSCPFERSSAAKEKVQRVLEQVGFTNWYPFDTSSTHTQALLAVRADLAVLAFRGTEALNPNPGSFRLTELNLTDGLTDANIRLIDWPATGGKVHQGFANALQSGWPAIAASLAPLTQRLLITGHSLGAALATLAITLHRNATLYTFGSPRVGNARFVEGMRAFTVHAYVNCCDLVCQVPPEILSYRHVGPSHYIDRHGDIHDDWSSPAKDADRIAARAKYLVQYAFKSGNLPTRDLADHSAINYVSAIAGLRDR